MKFKILPDIETKRLQLNKIEAKHVDIIFKLRSNAIVTKYIERPLYKNRSEARLQIDKVINQLKRNESITWVISLKGQPTIDVGTICLWNFSHDKKKAEVGYDLLPEYFNKGIMSEALQVVLCFGFNTLQLTSIEAYTKKTNINSIRLLEKFDFKFDPNRKDPDFQSNNIYILNKKDDI